MFGPCSSCHLRKKPVFRPFSSNELAFISAMKSDQVTMRARSDIVREGEIGGPLYTLLEGWAVRYHRLPSGSRQVFDILLPGDAIGLESALLGVVRHSVQALTSATLCVLEGRTLQELFDAHPGFALSVFRTRVEEEQRADIRLALLGRRTALQRLAYLIAETCDRLRQRGMANGGTVYPFPLTRSHLADATSLSTMHLGRVLNEMKAKELAVVDDGTVIVINWEKLAQTAGYLPTDPVGRRAIL